MRTLCLLLLVAGCGDRALDPGGGEPPGGANPTFGSDCRTLDQSGCQARSDCHALYTPEAPCDNICCASHFQACADGARADCSGDVTCNSSPPQPCPGNFARAVADGCWAGCVPRYECEAWQGSCGPSPDCASKQACTDLRGETICVPPPSPPQCP